MKLQDTINQLAEEAILLEPGNLPACASMLKLLETINESAVREEKTLLITYLEQLIMNDLEGEA
ncbi:hypothetical protein ACFL6P_09555, partial [Candidatus Latescibacterota bacterium]